LQRSAQDPFRLLPLNVRQNDFNKVYRAKHVPSKAEGAPGTQNDEPKSVIPSESDGSKKKFLPEFILSLAEGVEMTIAFLCAFARVIVLFIDQKFQTCLASLYDFLRTSIPAASS
jgi:hypothetical protein